jgi:hypothetical protein
MIESLNWIETRESKKNFLENLELKFKKTVDISMKILKKILILFPLTVFFNIIFVKMKKEFKYFLYSLFCDLW